VKVEPASEAAKPKLTVVLFVIGGGTDVKVVLGGLVDST
jgi:hypothetical protein